jgi:fatty-acid desaturase
MHDETKQRWRNALTAIAFFVVGMFVTYSLADLLGHGLVLDAAVLGVVWVVGGTLAAEKLRRGRDGAVFWIVFVAIHPAMRATGIETSTWQGTVAFFAAVIASYLLLGVPIKRWLARADSHRAAS